MAKTRKIEIHKVYVGRQMVLRSQTKLIRSSPIQVRNCFVAIRPNFAALCLQWLNNRQVRPVIQRQSPPRRNDGNDEAGRAGPSNIRNIQTFPAARGHIQRRSSVATCRNLFEIDGNIEEVGTNENNLHRVPRTNFIIGPPQTSGEPSTSHGINTANTAKQARSTSAIDAHIANIATMPEDLAAQNQDGDGMFDGMYLDHNYDTDESQSEDVQDKQTEGRGQSGNVVEMQIDNDENSENSMANDVGAVGALSGNTPSSSQNGQNHVIATSEGAEYNRPQDNSIITDASHIGAEGRGQSGDIVEMQIDNDENSENSMANDVGAVGALSGNTPSSSQNDQNHVIATSEGAEYNRPQDNSIITDASHIGAEGRGQSGDIVEMQIDNDENSMANDVGAVGALGGNCGNTAQNQNGPKTSALFGSFGRTTMFDPFQRTRNVPFHIAGRRASISLFSTIDEDDANDAK